MNSVHWQTSEHLHFHSDHRLQPTKCLQVRKSFTDLHCQFCIVINLTQFFVFEKYSAALNTT